MSTDEAKVEDLRTALECAAFFGVPSLLQHVREWIASNLKAAVARDERLD